VRIPPPSSLDSDELASWARNPVTKALADALRERWSPKQFKTVSPENLARLQGNHEVIDALAEWFDHGRL
jgi:hypothetical protein